MNGENGRLLREMQKIKREIETHGKPYTVYRNILNEDGEPTGDVEQITILCGLFHITGGYVSRETYTGTETRTSRSPMLLCLWDDSETVKNKDFVIINDQRFNIINKRNVNEYKIVCDMSLEVVKNGYN